MTIATRLRTLKTLLRIGAIEAVTYRLQTVVWLLSTTMPLIMIALFTAVTREKELGSYTQAKIACYFLSTFIVRNLTASWISWQINLEIRDGTLGSRLLLPIHPLLGYTGESVGAMPVRLAASLAVAAIILAIFGRQALTGDLAIWGLWCLSVAFAWLLSLLVSATIGALAFFAGSSAKVMDAWLAGLFVFSGYLIPLDLFPPRLRAVVAWLPFRYQLGLPVELMTGVHDRHAAGWLVARQLAFVTVFALLTFIVWRRGLARFAAYGG